MQRYHHICMCVPPSPLPPNVEFSIIQENSTLDPPLLTWECTDTQLWSPATRHKESAQARLAQVRVGRVGLQVQVQYQPVGVARKGYWLPLAPEATGKQLDADHCQLKPPSPRVPLMPITNHPVGLLATAGTARVWIWSPTLGPIRALEQEQCLNQMGHPAAQENMLFFNTS